MATYYPRCSAVLKVVFEGLNDTDVKVFPVRASQATVHHNSYREADTFDLEFSYRDFPFSPEVLKTAAVEITMWEATDALSDLASPPVHDDEDPQPTLVGLVDDGELHLGKDGGRFSCTGRDYTCLMLDKQWDTEKGRVPDGDLVEVVQGLVNVCTHATDAAGNPRAGAAMMQVILLTDDDVSAVPQADPTKLGTLGKEKIKAKPAHPSHKKKAKQAAPHTSVGKSRTTKKGTAVRSGRNYWDVIYQLCLRQGFVPYVDGLTVWITKPQTLQKAAAARAARVAYGRNLSSLDVKRKMGKDAVPQIVVTSYDPGSKRSITGKYPDKATQKTSAIGTKRDESRLVTVAGITDPGVLKQIAESYYNAVARSEGTIRCETIHLRCLDGTDLMRLKAGDPLYIQFDAFNDEELHKRRGSQAEREAFLMERGYRREIAELVAEHYQQLTYFQRPFYVRDVTKKYSKSGITLTIEGANFISMNVQQ